MWIFPSATVVTIWTTTNNFAGVSGGEIRRPCKGDKKMTCKQLLGSVLYKSFARHLPASDTFFLGRGSKILRGFCAKLILPQCGKNVNIDRNADFARSVKIGDESGIGKNSVVGAYTTIGKYVMMGPECFIYTRNHAYSRTDIPMCKQGFSEYQPVTIGNDVWIGARVTILPGASIGNGVVIAAGSVVTGHIPDYAVAAGIPARVKKYRSVSSESNRVSVRQ